TALMLMVTGWAGELEPESGHALHELADVQLHDGRLRTGFSDLYEPGQRPVQHLCEDLDLRMELCVPLTDRRLCERIIVGDTGRNERPGRSQGGPKVQRGGNRQGTALGRECGVGDPPSVVLSTDQIVGGDFDITEEDLREVVAGARALSDRPYFNASRT